MKLDDAFKKKIDDRIKEFGEAMSETDEDTISIGFKRLNENATIPTKAHPTDSGFDLYASEDVIIEPGETVIVPTGIAVDLPKGFEVQVRPRSGVTSRTKLRVQLGTIDNGYTGEIGVIVDNINNFSADNFVSLLTRSEEHTSELQSRGHLVCRLLLEKKKRKNMSTETT